MILPLQQYSCMAEGWQRWMGARARKRGARSPPHLLDNLEHFLQIKFSIKALHGRDALTAVALLDADVNVSSLADAFVLNAFERICGGDGGKHIRATAGSQQGPTSAAVSREHARTESNWAREVFDVHARVFCQAGRGPLPLCPASLPPPRTHQPNNGCF